MVLENSILRDVKEMVALKLYLNKEKGYLPVMFSDKMLCCIYHFVCMYQY